MRRHSHGCHRLHNHIAVRLMSFVLAHRAHVRVGEDDVHFHRNLAMDGFVYELDVDQGGYVFELERPLPVNVIRAASAAASRTRIEGALPR